MEFSNSSNSKFGIPALKRLSIEPCAHVPF
jgi:hypothetical protein